MDGDQHAPGGILTPKLLDVVTCQNTAYSQLRRRHKQLYLKLLLMSHSVRCHPEHNFPACGASGTKVTCKDGTSMELPKDCGTKPPATPPPGKGGPLVTYGPIPGPGFGVSIRF